LLCGQAPFLDLLQSQYTALSDEEVAVTPQGIHLHIKNRPLQEVLRYIQDAMGWGDGDGVTLAEIEAQCHMGEV
jgi:hypothetical protein